jgi:hypothetical protein
MSRTLHRGAESLEDHDRVTQHMTAAVLCGKERLEIETVDVPQIGAGDVLVRVRR